MDATSFTPITGLLGGVLIGVSAVLLLLANGRIAGISGILGGLLKPVGGDVAWRASFIVGMLSGGVLYIAVTGDLGVSPQVGLWPTVIAGFIVGVGTRLGSGCTSGHGVCGIGRLSQRSLVATVVFMITAAVSVFVIRHVLGGAA